MRTNPLLMAVMIGLLLLSCSKDSEELTPDATLYSKLDLKSSADKVLICHFDDETGEYKTLSVASKAVDAHLNHGDYLGPCITSVGFNFDSCTLEGLETIDGAAYSTQNGLLGCGAELNHARLETTEKFGYGIYEMDAKPLNVFSNQYLRLFISDDRATAGIDLDVRPAGTDDAGLGFFINGTRVVNIVGSAQMPVSYPNWYHVKVEVTPDYVKLWLDDTLMYEQTNYGGINDTEGYWGIASYSRSSFDNLLYTKY